MNIILILSLCSIVIFSGCASVIDAPGNILGFSRRGVHSVRDSASYQVYKAVSSDVFNVVISEVEKAKYYIFTKDEIRGFIMIMGIPGVVDTTEVGIFVTSLGKEQGVKVELSSRSTPAKRIVAATLFSKLGEKFSKI